MAAPGDTDFGYYPGTHGVPSDDTSQIVGPINATTDMSETALNSTIFGPISLPASGSIPYFGGAYRRMNSTAPSSAANPRIYNRAGALLNVSGGTPRIVATVPTDVGTPGSGPGLGLQVRCIAQVGGVWTPQWINLNGTSYSSDVAGGIQNVDALTAYRWELAFNGFPITIPSDVGCFIDSQLCAIIRGTQNPRRGIAGAGNSFCSAEIQIAVSPKNLTLEGTNRLSAPTPLGDFSPGVVFGGNGIWAGSDQSIVVPGGPLVPTDYFAYGVQFTAWDIPAPLGNFVADIGIICNPGT